MIFSPIDFVIIGPFIHAPSFDAGLEVCRMAAIGVNDEGRISFIDRVPDSDLPPFPPSSPSSPSSKESVSCFSEPLKRYFASYLNLATSTKQKTISKYNLDTFVSFTILTPHQFILPGFIDSHTHAPQHTNTGLGLDEPLLTWLQTYTFPMEHFFEKNEVAECVYPSVVFRHVLNGTTSCVYFATIHVGATNVLASVARTLGQRAWVGKVSMDRNCPDYYREENVETCIRDLERTIEFIQTQERENDLISSQERTKRRLERGWITSHPDPDSHSNSNSDSHETKKSSSVPLISPIVTPRFAPTCSPDLLTRLSETARKYDLPIQSHVSENIQECEWVRSLFPHVDGYTAAYEHVGCLTPKTLLAHGVYLTKKDRDRLSTSGSGIVHCPSSNINLMSGWARVRWLKKGGVKVGLGTDVSGGHSHSMLTAMRACVDVSKVVKIEYLNTIERRNQQPANHNVDENNENENVMFPILEEDASIFEPLTPANALYLATMGSAELLNMEEHIGSIHVGKLFDAILVDVKQVPGLATTDSNYVDVYKQALMASDASSTVDLFAMDDLERMFDKFFYGGDDRNITKVWVGGRLVKGALP